MKQRNIILILILFGGLLIVGCNSSFLNSQTTVPAAEKGVLDLRKIDLATRTIRLDGQWWFYWREFIDPQDAGHEVARNYLTVPGKWNGELVDGSELNGSGYATLKLLVLHNYAGRLAIHLPQIYTAYKLYLNGELIAEAGKVAKSEDKTTPQYLPQVAGFNTSAEPLELVLHIANFHHRKGGIPASIYISPEKIILEKRERSIAVSLFVFSCAFLLGFSHIILFFQRKDVSLLYFGGTSISMAIWTVSVGEKYFIHLFPGVPWTVFVRVEYLAMFMGIFFFASFVYSIFRKNFSLVVIRLVRISLLLISLSAFFLPSRIFTQTASVFHVIAVCTSLYMAFVIIRAIKDRHDGVMPFSIVFFVFLIATINDVLFVNGVLPTFYLSPFGLLANILIQATYLSWRNAKMFNLAKKLSVDLEKTVVERTQQLEQSRDILEDVSKERMELLHILCHDLTAPFLGMKSLLKIIKENFQLFDSNREAYLENITNSVDTSLELIEHVRAMRDVYNRKITPKPINLLKAVNLAQTTIDNMLIKKNIELDIKIDARTMILSEQAVFTHSVLLNVLNNAVKYSKHGSTITVSASEDSDWVKIKIKDNGIGIPKQILDHLFSGLINTTRAGTGGEQGTGIGLSLVKKFVEYYDGHISIISRSEEEYPDSHGTEVTIGMKKAKEEHTALTMN